MLLAGVLLLGLVYLLPLWKITLDAPQYPEGLGMYIRINTVEGVEANNLNQINNLNHYIGMKPIHPDTIPELNIMPWVVLGLIVSGLFVVWCWKRTALMAWLTIFTLVAIVGLVDFYKWEYDYGHNLDMDNAIIKIPDMNYQPPLFGSKQLLNFKAHSYPATGGIVIFLSFGLVVTALVLEIRRDKTKSSPGEAS
ncbi:MAG: hypothetical protein K9N34_04340 [Candidatus Marinimicrobia bacterium]|nr:hypothetical protein [Candidatus Neomarinimicrobiota bacterium]MCF7840663.1 hypothetical protein [Candidatus Neomarinimicrobiota bacterium]